VLGFGAVAAGLILAVLGIGTVLGGLIAPRVIGRADSKRAIVIGLIVQGISTAPLALAGQGHGWAAALLILAFLSGTANLIAIVGYNVTSTAGIPGHQQGLATGLVTMSQQIGITLGTPIMSAIVASQLSGGLLHGIRTAIAVNAALCLASALLVGVFLALPGTARDEAPDSARP
jgi:MFS family permease